MSSNGKLFWKTVALRNKLSELSRRCSYEALEQAIKLLEANSIPAWKEPPIDWDKTEVGDENSNPERFVPAEVLWPSVQKLRDKMARIQKEVVEKKAKGEKLEMDD
jgi:hypothetical protein